MHVRRSAQPTTSYCRTDPSSMTWHDCPIAMGADFGRQVVKTVAFCSSLPKLVRPRPGADSSFPYIQAQRQYVPVHASAMC